MFKKIKKLGIITILFIVLAVSAAAVSVTRDTIIWNETFEYSSTYVVKGYDYFGNAAANKPQNIGCSGCTLSFGWDDAATASGIEIRRINTWEQTSNLTTTDKDILIEFDFYLGLPRNVSAATDIFDIILTSDNGNNNYFRMQLNRNSYTWDVVNNINASGAQCSHTTEMLVNEIHNAILHINFDDDIYSLYIDSDSNGCFEQDIGYSGQAGKFADGIDIDMNVWDKGISSMIDNIYISEGTLISGQEEDCQFPQIFCDNFNYETALAGKDYFVWNADNIDGSTDYTFSPENNRIKLEGSDFKSIRHQLSSFPADYTVSSSETIKETQYAPVFSVELDVIPKVNNFTITSLDKTWSNIPFEVRGVPTPNSSVFLDMYRLENNGSYVKICDACAAYNTTNHIKIVSYFIDHEGNHFNASFSENSFSFFNTVQGATVSYIGLPQTYPNSLNLRQVAIVKDTGDEFHFDNYKVYVGTDPVQLNDEVYYSQLYDTTQVENITLAGAGSADLIDRVPSFWYNWGLRSAGSRVLFGLLMLLMFALIITGVFLSVSQTPKVSVIVVLVFIAMLIEVYVKLLPIWIPIVLGLLSAGIGAWAFKQGITQ